MGIIKHDLKKGKVSRIASGDIICVISGILLEGTIWEDINHGFRRNNLWEIQV